MDLIKVKRSEIQVSELIGDCLGHVKTAADKKDLEINIVQHNDFSLYVDPVMIKAVLRNLITNAIKFSYIGGQITIATYLSDDKASISVQDRGTGIHQEVINNLFSPGAVSSNEGTAKETGSGLGLIISKDYTEKNGGSISVESEPGKGSVFTITFPRIH